MTSPRRLAGTTLTKRSLNQPRKGALRESRECGPPRAGQTCPNCGKGQLDYDGLLQLSCPLCGYVAEGGSFT